MLFSTPLPPQEGIGVYVNSLSKKLYEKGHEVTLLTRGSFNDSFMQLDHGKIYRYKFLPIYPFHVDLSSIAVNKFLKKHEKEFDLIHVHTPLPPVPKTNLPIITTLHSSIIGHVSNLEMAGLNTLGMRSSFAFATNRLTNRLLIRSQQLTAVSLPTIDELNEHFGVHNIQMVGNGVDEVKFFPSYERDDPMELIYVGRLSNGKGLFDLVEAARILRNQSCIHFSIYGGGELEKQLKARIGLYGLNEKITVAGKVKHSDLPAIYRDSLAFIFPSHYEGMPTSVLEAMSTATPIIASDIPGNRQLIKNGKNGLLFKKGNPGELARCINLVAEDRNLRMRLARQARIDIESNYTWNHIANRFEDLYNMTAY